MYSICRNSRTERNCRKCRMERQQNRQLPTYFTDKDGIVKVTALKDNGDEICTGYYAFDENGYMLTGRSKVSNDYYYFKTVQ